MLAIAICDDNLDFAQQLRQSIRRGFEVKGISCRVEVYDNAEDPMQILETDFFDILCLDIEIGSYSGIEIGNSLRHKQKNQISQIVFISSYPTYHETGQLYSSVPMAFIRKPFNESDIENIVFEATSRLLPEIDERYFLFEYKKRKFSVLKRDIIYIEAKLRLKTLHTTTHQYSFNATMSNIVNDLDCKDFILIHQSFLVNAKQIETINKQDVVCRNGVRLPVSSTYYKDARLLITQIWEEQKRSEVQRQGDELLV